MYLPMKTWIILCGESTDLESEESAINKLTAKKSTPGPEKPYSRDCCHTVIAMSLCFKKTCLWVSCHRSQGRHIN